MKLTSSERAVVGLASGADMQTIDEYEDHWRTFGGLSRERLLELTSEHAGYVKNNTVGRLPDVDVLGDFLEEFPFFRAHGFFHNLRVAKPVEVYITGLEFVPCKGLPLASFDDDDLREMKRRFLDIFFDADYIHVEDSEMVAEYYFERLLEAEY